MIRERAAGASRGGRTLAATLAAFALAAVAVAAVAAPAAAADQVVGEYPLKAAFVRNIVKFVTWPAGSPDALTLCILGEDPFGGALAAKSDLGDGRSLAGRRIEGPQEAAGCQVVFVPVGQRAAIPDLLEALGSRPVLTVGDADGMALEGLMFNFLVEAQKVRFEANLAAARRAGMTVSSRLLGLAKTVHNAR